MFTYSDSRGMVFVTCPTIGVHCRGLFLRHMTSNPPFIWIAELRVSPRTREKLSSKHGLSVEEVEEAVLCKSGLPYSRHIHPERGERLIIRVTIRSRRVLVVLYPTDDLYGDCWNLGSAYFE